jgi:SpoIID/LytB domain protein
MERMRRRLGSVFVALALVVPLVGATSAGVASAAPTSFVFAGSGFGHGVGMSQYGAYGQAVAGRSAAQIIQSYYSGSAVTSATDAVDLRVNLLHASPTAAASSEAVDGGSGDVSVAAGTTTTVGTKADVFEFGVDGANVVVNKNGTTVASAPVATILWSGTPTVLNLAGTRADLSSGGHRYRYGLVEVSVLNGKLEAVNVLKLHGEYLRGIAEVPSSWPAAALQAQVIAARTYALRKYQAGVRADCQCHVYDTTADQVFAGWDKENGAGGANWVAAVDATSPSGSTGQVVTVGGSLITTFYFSSSGGRTENNEDVFGGSPLSYLRSVDDPWSLGDYNPRRSWSFTKTQAEVASAFGLTDVASIDLSSRTTGGSVKNAVATSSSGQKATISGQTLRSRLGLPGAWIRKPVVRIAGGDRYSTSVEIGKVASDSSTTVVIASGDTAHLVDGLVAAPLAAVKSAPLLLSSPGGLPSSVAAEIDRRKATSAYLVGGAAALGSQVESDLKAHGVTSVTRLAGADRYETGLAVAREMGGTRANAVIASGDVGHLVDALAAGGPAAHEAWPILLVSRDAVPDATRTALTERGVSATTVVGGTSSISDATMSQLPSPNRLAGGDRYGTALAVADAFSGPVGVDQVVVGSGADANLVDSLPGGALEHLIVLTSPAPLTPATKAWLQARPDLGGVQVLGGTAAIADSTLSSIRSAVGG